MAPKYRHALPQLEDEPFLTDGGLETTLIFDDGLELPDFAAFVLLDDERGTKVLGDYFERYARLAAEHGVGIVLETPTWRASQDWGDRLGYDATALREINQRSVALVAATRGFETPETEIVISGCVGPRGDGYVTDASMTVDEARAYHAPQVEAFADSDADMIGAITMTYAAEAAGLTIAAEDAAMPIAVSFTVETDGRLPSGQPLGEAIEEVDEITSASAAYFMVNCAHPTHFADVLDAADAWSGRLRGMRANASKMSHEELDAAEELDTGDPAELAERYVELREQLPWVTVLGGCCGTNDTHISTIANTCLIDA